MEVDGQILMAPSVYRLQIRHNRFVLVFCMFGTKKEQGNIISLASDTVFDTSQPRRFWLNGWLEQSRNTQLRRGLSPRRKHSPLEVAIIASPISARISCCYIMLRYFHGCSSKGMACVRKYHIEKAPKPLKSLRNLFCYWILWKQAIFGEALVDC